MRKISNILDSLLDSWKFPFVSVFLSSLLLYCYCQYLQFASHHFILNPSIQPSISRSILSVCLPACLPSPSFLLLFNYLPVSEYNIPHHWLSDFYKISNVIVSNIIKLHLFLHPSSPQHPCLLLGCLIFALILF